MELTCCLEKVQHLRRERPITDTGPVLASLPPSLRSSPTFYLSFYPPCGLRRARLLSGSVLPSVLLTPRMDQGFFPAPFSGVLVFIFIFSSFANILSPRSKFTSLLILCFKLKCIQERNVQTFPLISEVLTSRINNKLLLLLFVCLFVTRSSICDEKAVIVP